MKVKVRFQPGLPVVKVTYTLFEEDRALDDIKVEAPPMVEATAAPFDAALSVPAEAVGAMRLLAVAQVAERRGQYVLFDEVSFRVQPAAGGSCRKRPDGQARGEGPARRASQRGSGREEPLVLLVAGPGDADQSCGAAQSPSILLCARGGRAAPPAVPFDRTGRGRSRE